MFRRFASALLACGLLIWSPLSIECAEPAPNQPAAVAPESQLPEIPDEPKTVDPSSLLPAQLTASGNA